MLPQSVTKFRHTFAATLEAEQDKLTPLSTELFGQLYDEFGALEKRLAYYNEKIAAIGAAHPVCQRLGRSRHWAADGHGPGGRCGFPISISEIYAAKELHLFPQ